MKHVYAKKLLSLILALLMFGGAFAGCAGSETTETEVQEAAGEAVTEETAPEETEKKYLDNLPENMNYDGTEIRFITAIEKISIEVTDDDITGDILTDAYWKRNEALASRMNVKPVIAEIVGYGGIIPSVTQSVTAASDDYDIISGCASGTLSLATSHYVVNLNKIGYTDYIDVSQPYWSEKMVSNINYKDNLYWLAGDMTHSIIQETYAMFVNSTVWNNYHPGESVYDLVFDGKWTLDTMAQYAEGANRDDNGDGVYDINDSYGVIMQQGHILNGIIASSDVQYTAIDSEGAYSVALNNEHTIDVFTKLHNIFTKTEYGFMMYGAEYDIEAMNMFTSDRAMFVPYTFSLITYAPVREMESDFYVIPLPKYDESQKDYRVIHYDGISIYGVPTTVPLEKKEMVASALEAMCSMTSQMVMPTYYDVVLKNKYTRDRTTADMIDLIHDSLTADFCFYWGNEIGGLMNIFYDNIVNENIASRLKASERVWGKMMERLVTSLTQTE